MKVMRTDQVSLWPLASAHTVAHRDWERWKAGAAKRIGGQHFHVHIPPSTGHGSGRDNGFIVSYWLKWHKQYLEICLE